jgi:hypothetical protein
MAMSKEEEVDTLKLNDAYMAVKIILRLVSPEFVMVEKFVQSLFAK